MINKALKKAYKLRASGFSNGEIAKHLKESGISNYPRAYFEKLFRNKKINSQSTFFINLCCRIYRNTTNIEKAILYLNSRYNRNLNKQSFAQMCCVRGIKRVCQDGTNYRKVPRHLEKNIVQMYLNGYSAYEVASNFGYKGSKSIYDTLKRRGIKSRTQEDNDKAKGLYDLSFDLIDSEVKAYFIGFMLTDGSVTTQYGEPVGLQLNSTDEEVVEIFSREFGRNHSIYDSYDNNLSKIFKSKRTHRINITGKRYPEQVKRFGIVPRKSLILQAPTLLESEEKYIPYILRGIIDGDGWVRKDGKEFFICSASSCFIEWCITALESIGMINLRLKSYISSNKHLGNVRMYMVRTAILNNIVILNEVIYDKNFGMIRKYNRLKGRSETTIGSC